MSGNFSPLARYRAEIASGVLTPDPGQAQAVELCEDLYTRLCARSGGRKGISGLLSQFFRARSEPEKGLYFWGGVGRGKTHIVNSFHEALPFPQKLRVHFHGFMLSVHRELNKLGQEKDPLRLVARGMARQYRVICFDEFHVSDIADAMILGRLLDELFTCEVSLVATSNIEPPNLYKGGLQRERFLPAIKALQTHTTVYEFASPTDYRLRALTKAAIYHQPLNAQTETAMEQCFASLRPGSLSSGVNLEVGGRLVQTRQLADGIVWFDFESICETARSAADYIEIGRRFHTVLLSGVPKMNDLARDRVLRFIHLIDEFYEQGVNLIVSAEAEPEELYSGKRLAVGFARVRSRLREMQSKEYLGRPHLARPTEEA